MTRPGTSLVEVLVASVLLAIGVGGCLSTLAVAARFRERARARDELAAAAHHRLSWFVARGCLVADSARGADSTARLRAEWRVVRAPGLARFDVAAIRTAPLVDERLALEAAHPC
jgi:Tfp pilus assembly protein PilV